MVVGPVKDVCLVLVVGFDSGARHQPDTLHPHLELVGNPQPNRLQLFPWAHQAPMAYHLLVSKRQVA